MEMLMEIASALLLLIGSFLCVSGGVGILRFPDFYNRLHAAGVTDTLATTMILTGLMLQPADILVIVKLIIILLMTLLIGPTASHALAHAAVRSGLKPEHIQQEEHVNEDTEEVKSSKH